MQGSCGVTHCFTALVLRWSGGWTASHLQPHWPIRHADSVCACGCADSRHTHGAHCALSCEKSNPADDVPQQDLQLAPSHRHRLRSAHLYQLARHFCPKYPWNLWNHWRHICSLSNFHLPCCLLHSYRSQRRWATALSPQNYGCLFCWNRLPVYDNES